MLPIHLQMTLLLSARQRCYNLMGEFRKYYSKSDIFLTEMTMLENAHANNALAWYQPQIQTWPLKLSSSQ